MASNVDSILVTVFALWLVISQMIEWRNKATGLKNRVDAHDTVNQDQAIYHNDMNNIIR
jgi:hypothetical protein